jgi:predicted RNA-binding Zn ribbon-like protein
MDLETVAEFLNTVDERRFGTHAETPDAARDELDSPQQLQRWLLDHRLIDAHAPVRQADLQFVRELRAKLREHLAAPGTHPQQLNRLLSDIPFQARFDQTGPRLQAAPRSVSARFAADLVAAALAATARGDWYRLKLCAADDCRWAFYDDSRNGLGRWCAMRVCGNRVKTKRYRAQRHGRTRTGPAR